MCSHSANSRWLFPVELRIFLIWFFVSIFKIPFVFWIGLVGEKRGGHPPADGEAGEWGGGRLAPSQPAGTERGGQGDRREAEQPPPRRRRSRRVGGRLFRPDLTQGQSKGAEPQERSGAATPPDRRPLRPERGGGGRPPRPHAGTEKGAKKAQAS